ncbi:carboxylesterase/lipase family protein [Candidatus Solincola tengchongensis]|uniref:carboxylesterase/lipase family protein n=1 Tax=Candidatus Solincola tengchongensis TaxID=2900693 RepID=UPI00257D5774|nr:carboxylesterase/lipase family protein [Candidatus Solincola tengchongensis]
MTRRTAAFMSIFVILLVLLMAPLGCAGKEAETPASTLEVPRLDSGPISGVQEDGVWVYKGIPYAAPPVGELRWKEPQPVEPWEEVRPCTEYGPSCPQPEWPYQVQRDIFRITDQDEDCLYLNVWTPAKNPDDRLPVMVWIHGGGFTVGSGSQVLYEGKYLARKGVVVVTINYRLGPLGFMAHPLLSEESPHGVSGNYGLLDQIQALRWVQRNISAFGGDPGNVTIFGESAGGASVCALLASPLAEGLFHRAIAESGAFLSMGMPSAGRSETLEEGEKLGKRISHELGCDREGDELAALRSKTPQELIDAFQKVGTGLMGRASIGPVVDGYVLPDKPQDVFAEGRQHKVPLLIGNNADEGMLFLAGQSITAQQYENLVRLAYGTYADEVLSLFPLQPGEDPRAAYSRLFTAMGFAAPSRFAAEKMAEAGMPVYVYIFTMRSTVPGTEHMGAYHGYELPFVFGTLVRFLRPEDQSLSEIMMNYWTRFAAGGDPNGGSEPEWPRFEPQSAAYQELGEKVVSRTGYYPEAYRLVLEINGL